MRDAKLENFIGSGYHMIYAFIGIQLSTLCIYGAGYRRFNKLLEKYSAAADMSPQYDTLKIKPANFYRMLTRLCDLFTLLLCIFS